MTQHLVHHRVRRLVRPFAGVGALACAALAALVFAGPAAAQAYPSRQVTIVIPFPPGGGIDVLVRAMAAELGNRWKQPVVIENRPGAGSLTGAGLVAKAAPDGYTLMATVNQTMTANPFLYKSLPYDPVKSFAPITMLAGSDMLVLANPGLPANSLRELVDLVRREPGKHNFGSFGLGSQPHLMFALLNKRENVDLLHVPFNGIAPLITALTGGHVELTTATPSVGGELIKSGRLKALAIAGKARSRSFPNVPTTAEAGYPYLKVAIWHALFAPRGVSADVINLIQRDVKTVLSNAEFDAKQVSGKELNLYASTPAELATAIEEETAAMAEMVKIANIKPE